MPRATTRETRFVPLDLPGLEPGIHWQASLFDSKAGALGSLPYPVAVAWLTDFEATPLDCVVLDFILVPDQFRRRGYAISDAGERLVESLEEIS